MANKDVGFVLPFKTGTWLVFWGGDTPEENHHSGSQAQQYAFDLIMTDNKGNFVRTDASTKEGYFSYGQDVLAPADGTVVEVASGLRDNAPKELNNYSLMGNYIMIEHNKSTYSVLAHLKLDSAAVKVGDKVKAGQKIAQCGNSGNTTDPHLHFHVQDSAVFARAGEDYGRIDVAKGKKIFFSKITVNGKVKAHYSPVKGDKVGNTA